MSLKNNITAIPKDIQSYVAIRPWGLNASNGVDQSMEQQQRRDSVLFVSLMVALVMAVRVYIGSETPAGIRAVPMQSAATVATSSPSSATDSSHAVGSSVESRFSGDHAYAHVVNQVALGPRVVGSDAAWNAGEEIMRQLTTLGWDVDSQAFTFRGVKGRNIIARSGSGPIVMLGAHYDSRPTADREYQSESRRLPVPGANDGASGVAVLLELARVLDVDSTGHQVWLAFFDAEDRGGIEDWPYSVGAGLMLDQLEARPEAVVIVDMVGDADQQIFFEKFSDRGLSAQIWKVAERLGYGGQIVPQLRHAVGDDHLPFIRAGIPAITMIDFDYRYWHTLEDTPDKLSPDSLERVGRTLVTWLQELGGKQEAVTVVKNSH